MHDLFCILDESTEFILSGHKRGNHFHHKENVWIARQNAQAKRRSPLTVPYKIHKKTEGKETSLSPYPPVVQIQ